MNEQIKFGRWWILTLTYEVNKTTGVCNSKGQREGLWEWFYANGNIRHRTSYIDGKEDGIQEWFDKQGNITETRHWKDRELM